MGACDRLRVCYVVCYVVATPAIYTTHTHTHTHTQGDGSKIVLGLCIQDCPRSSTGSNANAGQALSIMGQLQSAHPDMGGMMFWDTRGDPDGAWSRSTHKYVCMYALRCFACFLYVVYTVSFRACAFVLF